LLENVVMKKEYQDVISEYLGVQPILINSSLVSAQNRKRLYWTNIPNITQPNDKGIQLESVIKNGVVDRSKSFCLDASYFKGGNPKAYFEKHRRRLVFNYSSSGRGNGIIEGRFSDAEKALTLTAAGYGNRALTGVLNGDMTWRKLTPEECEQLQTVPIGYTKYVSDSQRYKMLGNGWTCDVICHILSFARW
jgi:site-specific DNA-cytosine methylase